MTVENKRLLSALRAVFVPLASLLIRNGVIAAEAVEQLRIAFAGVARREHGNAGKPASVKKVSELTGISRRTVSSLLEKGADEPVTDPFGLLVESTILSTWVSSEKYQDDVGLPRILPLGPGPGTFHELISDVTGENAALLYLGKLLEANCVSINEDDAILMSGRHFSVGRDLPRVISCGLVPLASTMAHNWEKPDGSGFIQRVAHSGHVSASKVGTFRRVSRDRISSFLEEIDDVISNMESDEPETLINAEGKELSRLGVGAYYFEIEK